MKRVAVLLGLGVLLTVSCAKKEQETQVSDVSFTPCLQTKAATSETSNRVNVIFTGEGVKITHYNFEVTCDFTSVDVTHTFVNGFLNITQNTARNQADCVCHTDVSYTIKGLLQKDVNVIFINDKQVWCHNDKKDTGITCPETGEYGQNILHEKITEITGGSGSFVHSLKAVLPADNSSLKIIIKAAIPESYVCYGCNASFSESYTKCPKCGHLVVYRKTILGTMYLGSNYNWFFRQGSGATDEPMIFTAIESGKFADASVTLLNDFIIEYYENGAIEPTKVKNVKHKNPLFLVQP